MTTSSQAIEVEVVEIDGAVPPEKFEIPETTVPRRSWQADWQSRVRAGKFDRRWWPLWALLGIIAIAMLLTLGLFLGIIFVIFLILRGLARALFR